ncbi:flavohemoglobin expression-modulating QEGLA motif protein [Reichenbachiella agarivorans]|uniref:Flavohemoglobin expression-modulating QEGLA motif protein n=1 Tax=Reichenbachiella agarivorans TaxID=2979464 RepID=A0ABY6CRB5_9BACT|nr:flavohemoglobin expression-modulating QEGLA motif protein [Reichenbachiella agarivorans]UXP33054.1 flavohemoglobin expression-modulating QEGLA motif protein [Reichenbachiella agarivorans]
MTEKERIIAISDILDGATAHINILRNIAWPNQVQTDFFRNKAQKLPVVVYAPYDAKPVLDEVKKARNLLSGNDVIDQWAGRIADMLESSALLLQTRGTQEFFEHSTTMYGSPKDLLPDGESTALDLANHFGTLFENIKNFDLGTPPKDSVMPEYLAKKMKRAVKKMFGKLGPKIEMDDSISSNAIAGRRRIAINPNAIFSDKDIKQLIEHEVHIHVATSMNGMAQDQLKILAAGHSGTTETQEGLAVFSEFITGSIDLDRTRRLSDRVIATQMAIDGADFIQVYQYYLEKTDNPGKAFDGAKRVFRGGDVKGRAPFTKDIVYLQGLVRVQNFLTVAISTGKFEYINLLFCGKLDLSDIPALKQLNEMGLIRPPQYLPPWIVDKRYLLTHLTYTSFLSNKESSVLHDHYKSLLV